MATQAEYNFKILLIGDSGTGKSCLLLRFSDDYFSSSFIATIGVDYKRRSITIDNHKIKLYIYDSAGQDRYKTITSTYYRASQGIIIVYSITNRESFQNVRSWMNEITRFAGENVQKLIVGNKCDLEGQRRVSKEEAREFADSHGIQFLETSAKDSTNVDEAFNRMASAILAVSGGANEDESGISWKVDQKPASTCPCSK